MAPPTDLPALALEHVSVHFEGLRALNDVSFTVSSGEIVGMIGPNGAGKTTAFNVACGFVKPSEGRVLFPATNKTNLKPNQLAGAGVARGPTAVRLAPEQKPRPSPVSTTARTSSSSARSSTTASSRVIWSRARPLLPTTRRAATTRSSPAAKA